MSKNSSFTHPLSSKNSKYTTPIIHHMPDMSHITYANIISKIKVYSEYLYKIYDTDYLKNTKNTVSYYRKIEKKLKLTPDNTPKRYNKHLNILLAILYCASKLDYRTDVTPFIDYLMSIVSLLESSDITGIYHFKNHKTQNTYTDINNIFYFMIAKDYLKIIKTKLNVINREFYDQTLLENNKYNIIFISNTDVKTLLSLILERKGS
jgi:hypothetical protein